MSAVPVPVPADGTDVTNEADCPSGKQPISGSYFTTPGTAAGAKIRTESSSLFVNDTTGALGWAVTVANDGTVAATLRVAVICANVS